MKEFISSIYIKRQDYLIKQETRLGTIGEIDEKTRLQIVIAVLEKDRLKIDVPQVYNEIRNYVQKAFNSVYQLKSIQINLN